MPMCSERVQFGTDPNGSMQAAQEKFFQAQPTQAEIAEAYPNPTTPTANKEPFVYPAGQYPDAF